MFIGHIAVGLAAKKAVPKVSLGTLFLCVSFVDLLWPSFLMLGWEHVRIAPGNTAVTPLDFYDYPISHSLIASLGWSLLVGGLFFLFKKNLRAAVVLFFCVFSHWILDFASHRPDMPVFFDGPYLGLGLWNSVAATMITELAMFGAGAWLYVKTTRALNKRGHISFWSLIVFLVIMYFGNLFGPPPPDEKSLMIFAQFGWSLVIWGYWIDRNREAVAI